MSLQFVQLVGNADVNYDTLMYSLLVPPYNMLGIGFICTKTAFVILGRLGSRSVMTFLTVNDRNRILT